MSICGMPGCGNLADLCQSCADEGTAELRAALADKDARIRELEAELAALRDVSRAHSHDDLARALARVDEVRAARGRQR